MLKAVYILILFFCTQLYVVGQENDADALLNKALEIAEEQPEEAIELTEKAFDAARKSQDTFGMILAKSVMGDIGMQIQDYETAYINFSDALEFLEKSDTVDLYNRSSILNNLAIIKSIYGDHSGSADLYELSHKAAIEYVEKYPEIAEEYGDLRLLVDLPYDRSTELKKDGRYFEAGEILVELWEKSEFRKDTVLLAKVVNELGLIRMENKEYSKAQEFFAVAAFGEGVDLSIKATALHNLASSYMLQQDFLKAEQYFAQALELERDMSDEYSQFITMLDQGELAFINNDVSKAITTWESALKVYDDIESYPDLFIVYDWLQKAYLSRDIEKAALYGGLYTSNIKDWMNIQSSQKNNTPTLQAFNSRIDGIMADRQLKAERLAMLKRYWPFGVVALLLIMLLVYSVQVSFNKRRVRILEESLKVDRASVASEILNKIRRD